MGDPFEDGRAPILSDAQHAYLRDWLEKAAPKIGLHGWRINASRYVSQKDADASSWIADHGETTWVALGPDFLTDTPDGQRETLAHELLHPFFHRVSRMFESLVEAELGKRTEAIMESAIEMVEEQQIEKLSRAVAVLLPKVEFPA